MLLLRGVGKRRYLEGSTLDEILREQDFGKEREKEVRERGREKKRKGEKE